jgi:hypothetical protein
VDLARVDLGAIGLVLDDERDALTEGDVARRVLVEQRVPEDRLERADPAGTVDERNLAEIRGPVVLRGGGAEDVGVRVGVDLNRATLLEADADPVDQRAGVLERFRRGDDPVGAGGIGRRERKKVTA